MERTMVLIIDDDLDVADVLATYISGLGYETHIAESSTKGLELVKNNSYYAIFSDWKMPDIKGDEVLKRIKTIDPELADRFVLITGAVVDDETERKLTSSGARVLRKPFRLEEIKKTFEGFPK
ncbi:MAG: response regulator [Nitrospirae bacterium]|nr:response regulator [Nitrospirota bacterium]